MGVCGVRGVEEEEMGVWGEKSDRKCGDSRVREWIGTLLLNLTTLPLEFGILSLHLCP